MDLVATSSSLILVNLLFAGVALTLGFAAGAWVGGGSVPGDGGAEGGAEQPSDSESGEIDRERAMLASDRLRDLANNVATDVGAHNASIERIEAELVASRSADGGFVAESVMKAVDSIAEANADLQARLAKAEQQIEAQAEEIRVHESEARTDSLTQLANRRAFDQELARRLAEFSRNNTPVSLLILDVDHFKKFNDTHGHQAGDEVLRCVGRALAESARDMDLPCRYGGEEFALVLPATDGSGGALVAERVRETIEGLRISFEGKNLSVTVSLGLAVACPDEAPAELIRRADAALYQSKDAGRNNTHYHNGAQSLPVRHAPAADATADHRGAGDSMANRTVLLNELRRRVNEARDSRTPLAVLGAELDGHKRLREEFGDEIAELTIDSVGQFIESALRDSDFIGRLDRGRFIVLMPASDVHAAQSFGDRLRSTLAACTVPLGDEKLQLQTRMTAVGIEPGDTEVTLMQRAEAAMEHAELVAPLVAMA